VSNTRRPVKDTGPKAVKAVEDAPEEAPEISPELQALLDLEQVKLTNATLQAQTQYLSSRVAELVQEIHELKNN
jgi:hypothetical protein